MDITCNHCSSKEYKLYLKPFLSKINESKTHLGAWCNDCNRWIKWINQEGIDLSKIPEKLFHQKGFPILGDSTDCYCNIGTDHAD